MDVAVCFVTTAAVTVVATASKKHLPHSTVRALLQVLENVIYIYIYIYSKKTMLSDGVGNISFDIF